MSEEDSQMTAAVELVFSPDLDFVGKVRAFASELSDHSAVPFEWKSQIEVALHEMLENAVKTTRVGQVRVRVQVSRCAGGLEVELRTWNRAPLEHLEELQKAVAAVSAAPDPMGYYLELMRRTALVENGSGLGLGRIRAEAGMNVDVEIEGDRACVTARATMGDA